MFNTVVALSIVLLTSAVFLYWRGGSGLGSTPTNWLGRRPETQISTPQSVSQHVELRRKDTMPSVNTRHIRRYD